MTTPVLVAVPIPGSDAAFRCYGPDGRYQEISDLQVADKPHYRHMHLTVLGGRRHAPLALRLFRLVTDEHLASLLVASPNCFRDTKAGGLRWDRGRLDLAPSLGGRRLFTSFDAQVCGFDAALRQHSTARLLQLYRSHPLARRLAFICGLDERCVAILMCIIFDPRFHLNTEHPDRRGTLYRRLGLTLSNAREAMKDRPDWVEEYDSLTTVSQLCMRLVLHAWWNGHRPTNRPLGPRDFLWQTLADQQYTDSARSIIAVCKRFVSYLVDNWLDWTYRQRGWRDGLFDPALFFGNADQADAYKQYLHGVEAA